MKAGKGDETWVKSSVKADGGLKPVFPDVLGTLKLGQK
jgi:hypothetical protein